MIKLLRLNLTLLIFTGEKSVFRFELAINKRKNVIN